MCISALEKRIRHKELTNCLYLPLKPRKLCFWRLSSRFCFLHRVFLFYFFIQYQVHTLRNKCQVDKLDSPWIKIDLKVFKVKSDFWTYFSIESTFWVWQVTRHSKISMVITNDLFNNNFRGKNFDGCLLKVLPFSDSGS